MRSETIILHVANLSKTFHLLSPASRLMHGLSCGRLGRGRDHHALVDISFDLSAGETLGVLGRNGAGKTTLLGLLAGTISPTEGVLRAPAKIGTLISLGAGFDPESTGWDNLRQWGALHENGPFTRDEESWIENFTELGEALDRPVKTYSQGMQLRLGFAVATARRPDLLIIDEVMAVGDFFFRSKCHSRIRNFVEQGTAAILVSHDYTEILQFCRRALVLDQGTVAFLGPASEAVNRYLHSRQAANHTPASTGAEDEIQPREGGITWPEASEGLDATRFGQSQLQGLRVLRLACCNTNLQQQWVFSQGEMASIFVEVTADEDLEVPVISVLLTDERGVIIHGSSSHMRGQAQARRLLKGRKMQVQCDIGMCLRYGEYRLDIAFAHCPLGVFPQRARMTFESLGAEVQQLGRCDGVGVVAVVPRQGGQPTQLTHHGICDLPGTMHSSID